MNLDLFTCFKRTIVVEFIKDSIVSQLFETQPKIDAGIRKQ